MYVSSKQSQPSDITLIDMADTYVYPTLLLDRPSNLRLQEKKLLASNNCCQDHMLAVVAPCSGLLADNLKTVRLALIAIR